MPLQGAAAPTPATQLPDGRPVNPVYPDPNNDGIIDPKDAPKPNDVDPEVDNLVNQIQAELKKGDQADQVKIQSLMTKLQDTIAKTQQG